jgi:hypothetical protein
MLSLGARFVRRIYPMSSLLLLKNESKYTYKAKLGFFTNVARFEYPSRRPWLA